MSETRGGEYRMSENTFAGKFKSYGQAIPQIFATGSDAEVAQIAKNIDKLGDFVSELRKIHDACYDQIAVGTFPVRGESVKRIFKIKANAVVPVVEVAVENDPLAGEL
jgi:hypothetical protein